jgi:hypothetical protein
LFLVAGFAAIKSSGLFTRAAAEAGKWTAAVNEKPRRSHHDHGMRGLRLKPCLLT